MNLDELRYWLLGEDRVPVSVPYDEYLAWAESGPAEDRFRVARTQIDGDCYVSTVFLAQMDLSLVVGHAPREPKFETMVFGGAFDGVCYRYATWAEAEAGHARIVEIVLAGDGV